MVHLLLMHFTMFATSATTTLITFATATFTTSATTTLTTSFSATTATLISGLQAQMSHVLVFVTETKSLSCHKRSFLIIEN